VEERRISLGFEVAGRTDAGRVRHTNQDRFAIVGELGLAVVCDGMGGAAGGEIASSLAIESFVAVARREIEGCRGTHSGLSARALRRATAAANRAVRARAEFDTRFRGMGTTLVAARMDGHELTVVNVGDSRAYVARGGAVRQLTSDHSYVGERMRMGLMTEEEAARSPLQSVITRAVGTEEDVRPELFTETIEAGDQVLLCSDGLTRHVSDEAIASAMCEGADVASVCERLIALANAAGGSDNITCVVVRLAEPAQQRA
jgi:protein phosphatase